MTISATQSTLLALFQALPPFGPAGGPTPDQRAQLAAFVSEIQAAQFGATVPSSLATVPLPPPGTPLAASDLSTSALAANALLGSPPLTSVAQTTVTGEWAIAWGQSRVVQDAIAVAYGTSPPSTFAAFLAMAGPLPVRHGPRPRPVRRGVGHRVRVERVRQRQRGMGQRGQLPGRLGRPSSTAIAVRRSPTWAAL